MGVVACTMEFGFSVEIEGSIGDGSSNGSSVWKGVADEQVCEDGDRNQSPRHGGDG